MTLANVYLQTYGQIPDFFKTLQQGQAPDQFTQQLLKDIGFASSNHRGFIPLLKALGFLSSDGIPTTRYHEYRNEAIAPQVMAEALREAYSDLFVISEFPSEEDRKLILGKFKSTHNTSDRVAELLTKTFFSLLSISDLKSRRKSPPLPKVSEESEPKPEEKIYLPAGNDIVKPPPTFHYNIQIHLPATKDTEVYNAIFKSLKEHLLD